MLSVSRIGRHIFLSMAGISALAWSCRDKSDNDCGPPVTECTEDMSGKSVCTDCGQLWLCGVFSDAPEWEFSADDCTCLLENGYIDSACPGQGY